MPDLPKLSQFPLRNHDKLRYGDTDRQGHVNNAVFATLLETGRIGLLEAGDRPLQGAGYNFVLARLSIDFLAEITWPGTVEVGTALTKLGNSSIGVTQALFQHGKCVAISASVVVQVDPQTHRAVKLSDELRASFARFMQVKK